MNISRPVLCLFVSALLVGCKGEPPLPVDASLERSVVHSRSAAGTRSLRVVHRAPHTPPFKEEVVSLTARVGQAAAVTLHFQDGTPFARFSLSEESLRGATLQGRPVAADEAITITMRRVDASRYLVDMQPFGLVFNPQAPAEVLFYYEHAAVGEHDALEVWKQDVVGDAWEGVAVAHDRAARRLFARVKDFTTYAMATPY